MVTVTPNLAAFLHMLGDSEGTNRVPDAYRATFQGELSPGVKKPMHLIVDLTFHPAQPRPPGNLREWAGESLAFLGAQYSHSISTAAGRYQITWPTWMEILAHSHQPDFTGPSQDQGALWIIQQRGALELIEAGHVVPAIGRLKETWASLPGSSSKQPQVAMASQIASYTAAGGVLV